jgi:tRNA-splicing ligase RtcB
VLLDVTAPIGHDYWHLMNLAGRYAYAGREWVARKVLQLMGAREMELVHNHHNFAWREEHGGEELLVVRKGATPAFPGQRGFVGGSMGDDAVIVEGATTADDATADAQRAALYSTIHGAGRVLSRTAAAGKRKPQDGRARHARPRHARDDARLAARARRDPARRGARRGAAGVPPAPRGARRAGGHGRRAARAPPLVVVMAGADEFDPYKD